MIYKVIVTGPVGSGKTAAVNSLTNKNAALTDALVSDLDLVTKQHKKTTTVAMDFDVISLGCNNVVHVYGTPGQERFDFMWDILSQGAHGIIILLDLSRNYPFRDLKYYTNRFSKLISSSRLIIGLTHSDIKKDFSVESYQELLKKINIEADVIPIDARNKSDVTQLFYTLLNISKEQELEPHEPEIIKPNQFETSHTEQDFVDTDNAKSEFDDIFNLTKSVLSEVVKIEHVNSVSLSNSMGRLLHTTSDDKELNNFMAFLSGITPDIENVLNRGTIHRIMLRSRKEDNITLFVEDEKSLGVCSDKTVSVQTLSQQIEDLLQWL